MKLDLRDARLRELIDPDAALDTAVTVGADGTPDATFLPVLWEDDRLVGHLARANPHWRRIVDGSPALAIVSIIATRARAGTVAPHHRNPAEAAMRPRIAPVIVQSRMPIHRYIGRNRYIERKPSEPTLNAMRLSSARVASSSARAAGGSVGCA